MFFSASTLGFYDPANSARPADAAAITAQLHAELLEAQSAGQVIVADADGAPIAIDRPPPDAAEALAALRRERDRRLAASDRTQLLDVPLSAADRAAWAAYRQALRDLPETYAAAPMTAVWPLPPAPTGDAA